MRAIRVHETGAPEVMRLEEVADPRPGPGQVLLRVRAAGVNPVETYIRSGTQGRAPKRLPYTPGSDAAGIVEAVGEGVENARPGDRVYVGRSLTGTYAELALCGAGQVYPLPERVSFAQGAALGVPYATAYRGLVQRAGARSGETLLVHGATGGVGLAAVQLARAAGLSVIGTGGTGEGRREVLRQGAHHALDHREEGYLDRVPELTGGRGVDIVLEMLADVNLGRDLPLLAKRGRVVVIGSRGTVEITPRDLMSRDSSVLGMSMVNVDDAELAEIHAAIVAGLEAGELDPVIAEEIPLSEAPRAHRRVMEPGHHGKIVLVP